MATLDELTPERPRPGTWVALALHLQTHPEHVEQAAERTRDWPLWAAHDFRDRLDDPRGFPEALVQFFAASYHEGYPDDPWPRTQRLRGLRLSYPSAQRLSRSPELARADLSRLEVLQLRWEAHHDPLEPTLSDDGLGPLEIVLRAHTLPRLRELDATRAGLCPSELAHLADSPVRHLVLSHNPVSALELATSPLLDRLETLTLQRCHLTLPDLETLAAAPAPRLRHLDLSFNDLGDEAARILARAPGLVALQTVNLWSLP